MKFSSSPNRPSAWKEMKLADVCKTFTSGGTPSRKKPEYFENGTIPWVRTKELNDGVITEVEQFITPEALKNSSAKILPKDTVLLAMYGATVGKLGVLGIESSCNQACAAMVPKDEIVDFRFLYYLLLNHRDLIISQATGGAQQNLSGELIKGFTFDFPTYQEQEAISEVLWTLDEKIRVNNKLAKTLEGIAETVFKSWFVDFDPVNAKIAGVKAVGMDDKTASLFPDSMEDSELGLIPKGWKVSGLEEVATVKYGAPFASKLFNSMGMGLPLIRIRDLKKQSIATWTTETHSKGFQVTGGDLLVGMDGEFNPTLWFGEDSLVNQRICMIEPKGLVSNFFLYFKLIPLMRRIEHGSTGSTVIHLGKSDLDGIKLTVPTEEISRRFSELVTPLLESLTSLEKQNRRLAEIRGILLPRLISGELVIPDEMLAS